MFYFKKCFNAAKVGKIIVFFALFMSEMITLAKEIVNVVMKNKLYILLFLAFSFFGHNSLGTAEGNPEGG